MPKLGTQATKFWYEEPEQVPTFHKAGEGEVGRGKLVLDINSGLLAIWLGLLTFNFGSPKVFFGSSLV